MDPARALTDRLAVELGDAELAEGLAAGLDDEQRRVLVGDDAAASPLLSFTPAKADGDTIDSLWILAFGYRHLTRESDDAVGLRGEVPEMDELAPGPVNRELARLAAGFVASRPVPIIAQWEVARLLEAMEIPDVWSVEPDRADDGSVVYLSTAGVIEKGRRIADEHALAIGRAGLLAHADHASRCLMTAAAAGLAAAVPTGVELPAFYDARSGQRWTRSRRDYLAIDLLARAAH